MNAIALNESFKALVREAFPERSEKVITIFDEVINHKAAAELQSIKDFKEKALEDIRGEIATKDFVRAEIAEVRAEIAEVRAEIAEVRDEMRIEHARTRFEILKWVFAMQAGTIAVVLGGMKLLLG